MEKIIYSKIALLVLVISAFFISCSSTDEDTLSIDNDVLTKGISSDLDGGYFDVDVIANGDWSATLSSDCDWAAIMKTEGKGNDKITLFIEGNYTGECRTAQLFVTNAKDAYTINITQNNTLNGVVPSNGDDDLAFVNVASTKGLGRGYDLLTFKSKNAIINLKAIDSLMTNDPLTYVGFYNYNPISEIGAQDINIDSIEDKRDSLKVKLGIDIAYGTFKLGISGGYHGTEERVTNAKSFKTGANYPTLTASIDNYGAYEVYMEAMSDSTVKKDKDHRCVLLTPGFVSASKHITDNINQETDTSNYMNNSKLMSYLKRLISSYGQGVTVESTLGGMFLLDITYDSIYTKETMGLDSAKINASFGATFNVKGDVSLDYQKSATSLLEKSVCSCLIKGGNQEGISNIYETFKNKEYTKLNTEIRNWVNSLKTSDKKEENNSEVINVTFVPIWTLFEGTASTIVEHYIRHQYPTLKF